MADETIQEQVWRALVAVARDRRLKPEALAKEVLRDCLQRRADEELLARSERAARSRPFRLGEAEEIVRRHRRQAHKS